MANNPQNPQRINNASKTTPVPSTSSGGPQLPRLLPASLNASNLLPALERLCSAKRTVEFTPHQTETWLASLSVFDQKIVNEAILRIAHSDDPFPDLGKLVSKCEQLRRDKAGIVTQGETKIGSAILNQLAKAWNLEI
jgi:hypothetical protein